MLTFKSKIIAHVQKTFADWRLDRGVAAVEFALILPVMLTMYLGSVELTQALMAGRNATITARTLADLISQQQNQVPVTDSTLGQAFTAASAIMSPFASNTLAMTITSVEFVSDPGSSLGYDAVPKWTATLNNGVPRPCQKLVPASNSSLPSPTTLPEGVFGQGSIIVADVVYTYTPGFGGALAHAFGLPSVVTYRHSAYMRPRQWTGSYISYTSGTSATTC